MAITPNSDILLLTNCPLTNTHQHTIYFTTLSNQTNYFQSLLLKRYDNQSYHRHEVNKIKIGGASDSLYSANYLMFRNTAYGNKWFYAFILSVNYINPNTCEVEYEIDDLQTWFFDHDLKMSFVEREMSVTDNIGDNLVPEKLELGEYIYKDLGLTSLFSLYQIVIAATFDEHLDPASGGIYGGVFSGLHYNVFSSWQSAAAFLDDATENNKVEGIVSIFMLPIAFCSDYQATIPEVFNIERDKNYNNIDGYVPKNNKLFTFPYNMLYVTNNEGGATNYPFEYFSGDKCNFNISGAMCCTPECMVIPLDYKGVVKNYNEKLTIGNFPQCAYTIDAFKAYIAQNANQIGYNLATGIAQVGAGGLAMYASGGMLGSGTALAGVEKIGGMIATTADKSTLPPSARGGNSSIINMANEIKGFQFFYAHIRGEFARIIDDYFNVYGYATHRIKIPNRVIRPHWNYVKTVNANVSGNAPADSIRNIISIYDNGITFWRQGSEVGDYTLNNKEG